MKKLFLVLVLVVSTATFACQTDEDCLSQYTCWNQSTQTYDAPCSNCQNGQCHSVLQPVQIDYN